MFSLKVGVTDCGGIVGAAPDAARSEVSRNGLVEIGRPFLDGLGSAGLGSAGLGGPFRFLKGLLERRGEGRRSGGWQQGCQSVQLGNVFSTRNWVMVTGFPQLVKRGLTIRCRSR